MTGWQVANNPQQLRSLLDQLVGNSSPISSASHFFLYQLNDHQSMLRVDIQEGVPYKFFHQDLKGRAIIHPIKQTIENFLWDNWGNLSSNDIAKQKLLNAQLVDVSGEKARKEMLAAFAAGERVDLSAPAILSPEQAIHKIQEAISLRAEPMAEKVSTARKVFGFLRPAEKPPTVEPVANAPHFSKTKNNN